MRSAPISPKMALREVGDLPEVKKRRVDCTLQEWTEHQRALERGYDAKRRARKRAEGAELTGEERRAKREAGQRRKNPPSSSVAFDVLIVAMQALEKASSQRETPAEGVMVELETHLRSRVARLKATIEQ